MGPLLEWSVMADALGNEFCLTRIVLPSSKAQVFRPIRCSNRHPIRHPKMNRFTLDRCPSK